MGITRRKFLKSGGTVLASASIMGPSCARGLIANKPAGLDSFGFQVWTIREKLVADFAGTLKEMAALGYSELEMCSPLGYTDSGFGPLHSMKTSEMKRIISRSGLRCTSSHFNLGELRDHLDNRIEWARGLGMKQMVLSSFWVPEEGSLDEYRRAAQELNRIAEKTKEAGIQMAFHNHHKEFQEREGRLIYDVLLEEFDPELVKMQFQVAVVSIGYHAAEYFRKHPGRFISAHLADWSSGKKQQMPIGQGDVDWADLFRAAEKGGVKNVFVEMAPETFPASADFLKNLSF